MTPLDELGFLGRRWCDRDWSAFAPLRATSDPAFPPVPGLYRVRVAGRNQLAYVGQTGRSLRERVAMLSRGVLAAEMPFNDPHTAAPKLWSFRHAEGLEYEASVTPCDLPRNDRMGLECYLVWQYRCEAGGSPLCNFGRLHPRYATSANRSTGRRGRRLNDDEPDNGGTSVAPLALSGAPDSPDWMGLLWSAWAPLTRAELKAVATAPGVYRIGAGGEQLLYIGQSGNLAARLLSHSRSPDWPGEVSFSVAALPTGLTSAQLLEVENDLIAGYFAYAGHSPGMQFGQDTAAPPE